MRVAVICLGLAMLLPARLVAQETAGLALRIVSGGTGEPLAGVQVSVARRTALSDSGGVARLAGIAPGPKAVTIERIGYARESVVVDFVPGEATEGEVELTPQPIEVAGVRAVARGSEALRATGFFDRQQRAGVGTFLTPDMVEDASKRTLRLSSLMRTLPGVNIIPKGTSGAMITSHRGGGSGCSYAQVFMDGMRMSGDPVSRRGGPPLYTGVDIDALLALPNIEAVEWYSGVSGLPPQFNVSGAQDGGPTCGTLVIWTKKGR